MKKAIVILLVLNAVIWQQIFFTKAGADPEIYFFDVGQGDSEMIILEKNVQILIDGGPDNKILDNLDRALSPLDRKIDIIILSHPQLDHFGGLLEVLKRYEVGAFIYSGRDNTTQTYEQFKKLVQEKKIKVVELREGDKIKYLNAYFLVLSPSKNFFTDKDINNSTLAVQFVWQKTKALFTGDISHDVENYLISKYDTRSDILKISHHGSKNSSSQKFLNSVNPKISVIEVGKNSYGHPTKEVLGRLANVGTQIFRTDQNGITKIVLGQEKLNIFTQK